MTRCRTLPPTTGGILVAALVALTALAACAGPPDPVVGVAAHVQPASIERDVTYATPDGVPLTLDAYLPRHGAEPGPAVVLVHGGAFVAGSKDTGGVVAMARRLQDHGIATFAVSYRLAPQHTYPAAVDDVAAAVAWLRDPAQAATYGVDPERVGVVGTSAGATLALTLGARPAGVTRVRRVVALSAATLLTAEGLALGATEPTEVRATLDYLGCPAVDQCPVSEQASPALTVTPGSSPALLVHGTAESIPLPHAERMAAALTAAGVPHDLVTVAGDAHRAHQPAVAGWSRVQVVPATRLAPALAPAPGA